MPSEVQAEVSRMTLEMKEAQLPDFGGSIHHDILSDSFRHMPWFLGFQILWYFLGLRLGGSLTSNGSPPVGFGGQN